MNKLSYLLIVFCFPIFISAQQIGDIRNTNNDCKYRDSIMNIILPEAEKWRQDYNEMSKNQISPFKTQDPEVISTNADGHIKFGIVSYSAIFQKETNKLKSVDSLLFLSINSTCDEVILFSRQTGKADRQNDEDRIIFTWKEIDGLWQLKRHFEANKSKYQRKN